MDGQNSGSILPVQLSTKPLTYNFTGKSSESVQCAMMKACDACADMGQL